MPNMENGDITAIKLNDTTKPSNPPAGENKIYFKSGTMYKVNSAGTETAFATGSGDVVGPASAVDGNIAVFDGTTGKLIKDGGISVYTQGARVSNSTDLTGLGALGWSSLTFDTERYDTDTIHSTSVNPSRLTCKTAGKYMIFGGFSFLNVANKVFFIQILHSGTTTLCEMGGLLGVSRLTISTVYDLAINEYVELQWYNGNTATGTVYKDSLHFGMQRIG